MSAVGCAEAFRAAFDVSRETMVRLETHLALLRQWNRRINLVSQGSLTEAWDRHFADSAQLWCLRPPSARLWLDVGSGGGFPGLVVAAMAAEASELHVHLVESDRRKAAFLATVVRATGVPATVHAERVEATLGAKEYVNFRLHRGVVITAKDETTGERVEIRFLRTVAERKGRYKIYSTED